MFELQIVRPKRGHVPAGQLDAPRGIISLLDFGGVTTL